MPDTGRMDEIVALYDGAGRESGAAPRSRVRAENLRHGATAVVVFDPAGQVFVHQRTITKDLYPGLFDFAAGGVLRPGEVPAAAAARELEEELGVTTPLTPIREADYADARTSYRGFAYWTVTEQTPRLQPEEVAGGGWMPWRDLVDALDADPTRFMPDSVGLLGSWLRELCRVPPER